MTSLTDLDYAFGEQVSLVSCLEDLHVWHAAFQKPACEEMCILAPVLQSRKPIRFDCVCYQFWRPVSDCVRGWSTEKSVSCRSGSITSSCWRAKAPRNQRPAPWGLLIVSCSWSEKQSSASHSARPHTEARPSSGVPLHLARPTQFSQSFWTKHDNLLRLIGCRLRRACLDVMGHVKTAIWSGRGQGRGGRGRSVPPAGHPATVAER